MAAVFGKLEEFDSSRELWAHYVECLEQFFAANDLKDGGRRRAIFMSAVGVSTYRLLRNQFLLKYRARSRMIISYKC